MEKWNMVWWVDFHQFSYFQMCLHFKKTKSTMFVANCLTCWGMHNFMDIHLLEVITQVISQPGCMVVEEYEADRTRCTFLRLPWWFCTLRRKFSNRCCKRFKSPPLNTVMESYISWKHSNDQICSLPHCYCMFCTSLKELEVFLP